MTERDIVVEIGNYWVGKTRDGYVVFANTFTHSISDGVVYPLDADGLSIAVASCRYKARTEMNEWFALAMDCLNDHRWQFFAQYVERGVSIWKQLEATE